MRLPLLLPLKCRVPGLLSSNNKVMSTAITIVRRMASSPSLHEKSGNSCFVTTPIFYVNATPHIGHLYTTLLADAYTRFEMARKKQIVFVTGTDEHGMKIEKAAKATGVTPLQHCDRLSKEFQRLCNEFDVQYTTFIRTTDPLHVQAVQHFWEKLEAGGHIYKKNYEGWYSVNDEAFVPEVQTSDVLDKEGRQIKINTESGHTVEWCQEENYMFRLSNLIPAISDWITKKEPIIPQKFNSIVKSWLDEGFHDLSISRPSSRMSWGIGVPHDSSQTIYVWLDALMNYLTAVGYPNEPRTWPPTVQIVGKDILKFHAIYWPAFLIANGMELPQRILCHSHWTIDNVKMSKSLGNVVDPFALKSHFTSDAVRFFLLSNGVPHSDGNFNQEKMTKAVNSALADTLGNLLTRCTSAALNPHQIWPGCSATDYKMLSPAGQELLAAVEALPDLVEVSYQDLNFYRGIEHLLTVLRLGNVFVQEEKPWELVKKSPEDPRLALMMNLVMETLRISGIILHPVVPGLSSFLLDRLNVPLPDRNWESIRHFSWTGDTSTRKLYGEQKVLFQRLKS